MYIPAVSRSEFNIKIIYLSIGKATYYIFSLFIFLKSKFDRFSDGGQTNSIDGWRAWTEGVDGPGRCDEEQRLFLHRHLLRSHLQGGRLLDLHGTHGNQFRQALQGDQNRFELFQGIAQEVTRIFILINISWENWSYKQ